MKIIFLCGHGGPNYDWYDAHAEIGIGGSEECVIMLARALAVEGAEVTIVNRCGEHGGQSYNGVQYEDVRMFASSGLMHADLVVAWRDWYQFIKNDTYGAKAWLWTHDIPVGAHHPNLDESTRAQQSANDLIDKIVYLNPYHRNLSPWWPDDKSFICPIGVNQAPYEAGGIERDPARVLYFSHPNRGLDVLRACWPEVKRAVPSATLASFWWEPEHFRPPDEALGILPMQHLGWYEMAQETMRAGVFGYPCVFAPEISPATTIKAQMGGAYPVFVRQGGMIDTLQWGCGMDTMACFTTALISALEDSIAGCFDGRVLDPLTFREEMSAWAREKYSWTSVAKTWLAEAGK